MRRKQKAAEKVENRRKWRSGDSVRPKKAEKRRKRRGRRKQRMEKKPEEAERPDGVARRRKSVRKEVEKMQSVQVELTGKQKKKNIEAEEDGAIG